MDEKPALTTGVTFVLAANFSPRLSASPVYVPIAGFHLSPSAPSVS
jgi:hypothetical protein